MVKGVSGLTFGTTLGGFLWDQTSQIFPVEFQEGRAFSHYKILKRLGEGGCA